jgi:hypothetical protein
MSATSATPSPRPPRRRWRRLLFWLAVVGLLLMMALGTGLWWAWTHQTAVARFLLARLPLPVEIEMESIDGNAERVHMLGIRISDKATGEAIALLPEVTWKPTWQRVRHGELGELELVAPEVRLSQKRLAPGEPSTVQSGSSSTPLQLTRLSVRDAVVAIEGNETSPAVELEFSQEVTDLRLGASALPHVGSFSIDAKQTRVDGDALVIPRLRAEGDVDGTAGEVRLRSVVLDPLRVQPPPQLVEKVKSLLRGPSDQPSNEPVLKRLQVDELRVEGVALDSTAIPDWPKLRGEVTLRAQATVWQSDGAFSFGKQELKITALEFKPPTGDGLVRLPEAALLLSSPAVAERIHVDSASVNGAEIVWTEAFESWVKSLAPNAKESASNEAAQSPEIIVGQVAVDAVSLRLTKTPTLPYHGKLTLSLHANGLRVDESGLHSEAEQSLLLTDVELAEHPADREAPLPSVVKLKRGELALVPDAWNEEQRVSRLVIESPRIHVTPENTTFLKPAPPVAGAASPVQVDEPFWQRWRFDHLALTDGELKLAMNLAQLIELETKLELRTEPFKSVDGHVYHTLALKQLRISAPELATAPITNVEEITATVEWPTLWKTQRIESLRLRGGELDVNEVMKKLTGASPTTNAADAAAAGPEVSAPTAPASIASNWKVNRIAIADTNITLHRLAPGLPPVKFALNYDVWDMPLNPKQLAGRLEPQKIELTQLSLRSPFDPLREVAVMNTIFIHFTLDGLLSGRIDRVEVLNPTLNVGEDLFWYVDYYRKFAAGELPEDEPAPRMVSADKNFVFEAAGDVNVAPPGSGGWTVEELAVTGGKLVIAPKGIPLPGIPRPFPFSFVTRLESGKFQAELEIPSDTYTWENLKLEFENLRGHVLFNLPHKQVSNNLTETFRVDVIRYKQLHIEDCFLTVTYDAGGIYGQFGGEAYEGYVKGAFNIYNDTSYTWDGWITGTGVRTTEITQKMTPTYLLLDGKVDLSVIALGNLSEVYQTDISFINTEPGKFSITTLNNAIESIPTDIETYLQDITRIGIETVRDFDYETAEAKARFYGREGRGYLRLSGPHGTRNIEVNVFDHRWKVNKKNPPTSSATLHATE